MYDLPPAADAIGALFLFVDCIFFFFNKLVKSAK